MEAYTRSRFIHYLLILFILLFALVISANNQQNQQNVRQIKITQSPGTIDNNTPAVTIAVQYKAVCNPDSLVAEVLPNFKVGPGSPAGADQNVQVFGRTILDVTRGRGQAMVQINLNQFLPPGGDYRIRVFMYGSSRVHSNVAVARHAAHAENCHVLKVEQASSIINPPFVQNPPLNVLPIGTPIPSPITTPVIPDPNNPIQLIAAPQNTDQTASVVTVVRRNAATQTQITSFTALLLVGLSIFNLLC